MIKNIYKVLEERLSQELDILYSQILSITLSKEHYIRTENWQAQHEADHQLEQLELQIIYINTKFRALNEEFRKIEDAKSLTLEDISKRIIDVTNIDLLELFTDIDSIPGDEVEIYIKTINDLLGFVCYYIDEKIESETISFQYGEQLKQQAYYLSFNIIVMLNKKLEEKQK